MITRADVDVLRHRAKENPELLLKLPEAEQLAAAAQIVAVQDEEWAKDAYLWATEAVSTIDEAENAVLRFPDKVYLRDFFQAMDEEPKLVVPKSRRMTVTWAVATKFLHKVRYKPNVAAFVQSETETKSAFVVDKRMRFIEDHLAPIFRRPYASIKGVAGLTTKMDYGHNSYAWAIAQGSDVFRTYTPSDVFMDEIEFMTMGHQSFVAVLPFLEKKCNCILVSTSNGPHGVIADMARSIGFKRYS